MQAHSPKNGPTSQRKPQEHVKSCRDARAVLQQACKVDLYSQRQCTGPWVKPPPEIKVDLLPHSAKQLHQERQQD